MRRIAINGLNSKTGGGKRILFDYLRVLNEQDLDEQYLLLTASPSEFKWLDNSAISVVSIPAFVGRTILSPLAYEFWLGRVLRELDVDVLFNMGGLIVRTEIIHVSRLRNEILAVVQTEVFLIR